MPSHKIFIANGFTILEVLVSLAIITAMTGLGLFVSMDMYHSYSFRSESTIFVSTLERARSRSMANVNGTSHGIAVSSAGYTLFQGASYASRISAEDEYTPIDGSMTVVGTHEVVFAQLTGDSTVSDSMSLTDGISTATVSINYEGSISW